MLAIQIPWDPNLFELGGFRFTWHSLWAVIGLIAGVYVARRLGRLTTIDDDRVTTLALWAIAGGVVMARFLYVIDNLDHFSGNIGRVFALNDGGITVWGAPIGGAIAVSLAAWWMRLSVPTAIDIGSPGLILGMAIGRVGDLINGEHLATATDLPWAVYYTHAATLGQGHPVHPATTYELLGDLVIFGVLLILARRRDGPRPPVLDSARVLRGLAIWPAVPAAGSARPLSGTSAVADHRRAGDADHGGPDRMGSAAPVATLGAVRIRRRGPESIGKRRLARVTWATRRPLARKP